MNVRTKQDLVDATIALIPIFVMVLVMRPDVRRTMVMRSALIVKRFAIGQAEAGLTYSQGWSNVAAKASTVYQNARL